VLSINLCNRQF